VSNSTLYIDYKKFSLSEKIDFFDEEVGNEIKSMEHKELNSFLSQIILDNSENAYVRKSAQKIFVECVFINKIKPRQALTLLVDNWNNETEIFLEIQRIKDLYFFYDEEPEEIEQIFSSYKNNDELEIASEALLNLGLINMQKGFVAKNQKDMSELLLKSTDYLTQANRIIENRIDAQFYLVVVSTINDLIKGVKEDLKRQLNNLARLLYTKEAYSFSFQINSFDLGFYRILSSLCLIQQEQPTKWLDYKHEFTKLHTQYAEIKNQQIKNRLNESIVSSAFIEMIDEKVIEPYFSLNFTSQLSKIDVYLGNQNIGSDLHHFLTNIKTLIENKNNKKKVKFERMQQRFVDIFPNRNPNAIKKEIENIDSENSLEVLNLVAELKTPSIQEFIDVLMLSSIKLQGNKIYHSSPKKSKDDKEEKTIEEEAQLENTRNTCISNLLDSENYSTKDQTLWSKSHEGKSAGEIDIMVKNNKGIPFTIIEALNLSYLDKNYTVKHIDKVFTYDTTGFEHNFILVYSSAKKFGEFWDRYMRFISNHNYQYKFLSVEEVQDYHNTDIRIIKAKHIRNGKEVYLYHLGINLYYL
jgi:hypothetical protein